MKYDENQNSERKKENAEKGKCRKRKNVDKKG